MLGKIATGKVLQSDPSLSAAARGLSPPRLTSHVDKADAIPVVAGVG